MKIVTGLSNADVQQRISEGKTNYVKKTIGKSYPAIFIDNVLTLFNLIGLIVFVLMIVAGSWSNVFFYIVIFANTLIGVLQEIRAKRTVEKLSLMTAPTAVVVRDGKECEIAVKDIVLDDLIKLKLGKQIPADCVVIQGEIEANESLLTGESHSIKKQKDDNLLSGSFVVSGSCLARAIHVGKDNYVEQLSAQAKKYSKPKSQLMKSISYIIRAVALVVVPLGAATYFMGTIGNALPWQTALEKAGGSIIGMIPSGMVLLTSVTLAVSVLKMSKNNALVQDLYCVEMLSRVDTLCLDKTGTITDGTMCVDKVELLDKNLDNVNDIIYSLLQATEDSNDTARALNRHFSQGKLYKSTHRLPFSSERKLSGAVLDGIGAVLLGAPEFVLKDISKEFQNKIDAYTSKGLRTLLLASADNLEGYADVRPLALICLTDNIREDAVSTIKWFADNDVEIKVISGDNAKTVSIIAAKVGVKNADKYLSLDGMTDEEIVANAPAYTVFGRVKPEQKALLIKTLKLSGRTVAMTGDGVNDILAMKQADCAVAVATGSEAARSVAHLVLMDSKFSSMPKVVREGRQVVNNIQNASALFLMKTIMTLIVTVVVLLLKQPYPLSPRNLYVIEFFVIGIPAFFLALRSNAGLIRGSFLKNTLTESVPKGIAMALSVLAVFVLERALGIAGDHFAVTTLAMLNLSYVAIVGLAVLCYPFNKYSLGVCLGSVGLSTVGLWLMNIIFHRLEPDNPYIVPLNGDMLLFIFATVVICGAVIVVAKVLQKNKK